MTAMGTTDPMEELLEDLERVEAGVGTMARETTRSFQTGATDSIDPPGGLGGSKSKMPRPPH